jgi:HPt (histidine-containing phosphotransfer) domain-containing protein
MSEVADLVKSSAQYPADFEEYVDIEGGLKRVAGNKNIYVKIMKSFLASEELNRLRENLDNGDAAAAAISAHGLKGMSGNLSLTKLYERTITFEGQLKQGVCDAAAGEEFFAIAEKTKEYIGFLLGALS